MKVGERQGVYAPMREEYEYRQKRNKLIELEKRIKEKNKGRNK